MWQARTLSQIKISLDADGLGDTKYQKYSFRSSSGLELIGISPA